jgi:hypothetical protein
MTFGQNDESVGVLDTTQKTSFGQSDELIGTSPKPQSQEGTPDVPQLNLTPFEFTNPAKYNPIELDQKAHKIFEAATKYNVPLPHVETAEKLYGTYIGNKPDEFKTAINDLHRTNYDSMQAIGAPGSPEMKWVPPVNTEQQKVSDYLFRMKNDSVLNTKFNQFWLATDQAALNGTDLLKHIVDPETRAAIKAAQIYNQENPNWTQAAGGAVGGLAKIGLTTALAGGDLPLGMGLASIAHVPTDAQLASEESLGGQYGKEFLKGVATGVGFKALDAIPFVKTAMDKAVLYGGAAYGQTYAETQDKKQATKQAVIMGVMGLLGGERQKEDINHLKTLEPELAKIPDQQIIDTVSDPKVIQGLTKSDILPEEPPTIAQDESKAKTPTNVAPETGQAETTPDQAIKIGEEMLNKVVPPEGTPKPAKTDEPQEIPPEKLKMTSLKNEITNQKRAEFGLPPVEEKFTKTDKVAYSNAMAKIEANPRIADDIIADRKQNPRMLSDEEDIILKHKQIDLETERYSLDKQMGETEDENVKSELRLRTARVNDELQDIYDVDKSSGSEWGLAGRMRQQFMSESHDPIRMEQRARAKKESPLTEDERKTIKEQSDRLAELDNQLKEFQKAKTLESIAPTVKLPPDRTRPSFGSRNRLFTKERADIARAEIRKMMTRLNVGIDPTAILRAGEYAGYLFEGGVREIGAWSKAMIEDLGEWVKPNLSKIWGDIQSKVSKSDIEAAKTKIATGIESGKELSEIGIQIQNLARGLIESGVRGAKPLRDEVHTILREIIPDITRQETEDAISGSGKFRLAKRSEVEDELRDIKQQLQQTAKIRHYKEGEPAPATGYQRVPLTEEGMKMTKLAEEAKKRHGVETTDKETQLKSALDSRKTYYKNQITDIEDQIKSGHKTIKGVSVPQTDAELEGLIKKRNELKGQYDDIFGKPELTDEQRLSRAIKAAERNEANWTKRLEDAKNGIFEKTEQPDDMPKSDKLEAIKARTEALKEEHQELKDLANPKKTPEEIRLQSWKTRKTNRMAELRDKIARGDFEKKQPREPVKLDVEGEKIQADINRVENEYKKKLRQYELDKRPWWEKTLDLLSNVRKMGAISGIRTLVKLFSYTAGKIPQTIAEEAVGGVYSNLPGYSKLFKGAPREGGFNVKAIANALSSAFTKGLRDAYKVGSDKQPDYKMLYDEYSKTATARRWYNMAAVVHEIEKSPLRRFEYELSKEKRTEHAIMNSDNPDVPLNPVVQALIGKDAFEDSNAALLLEKNKLTDIVNNIEKQFEAKDKATGKTPLWGKVAATAIRLNIPVKKVAFNHVKQTINAAVGFYTGNIKFATAMVKGLDTLSPAQKDAIAKLLKVGAVAEIGNVLAFIDGYKNDAKHRHLGGYYQPGEKRDEEDVRWGGARLFGIKIPAVLLALPLIQSWQLHETIGRVASHEIKGEKQGITAGVVAAVIGLFQSAPIVNEGRTVSDLADPRKRDQAAGQYLKGLVDPMLIQDIANYTDIKPTGTLGGAILNPSENVTQRKPKGLKENIESGIPVLRKNVPEKGNAIRW